MSERGDDTAVGGGPDVLGRSLRPLPVGSSLWPLQARVHRFRACAPVPEHPRSFERSIQQRGPPRRVSRSMWTRLSVWQGDRAVEATLACAPREGRVCE